MKNRDTNNQQATRSKAAGKEGADSQSKAADNKYPDSQNRAADNGNSDSHNRAAGIENPNSHYRASSNGNPDTHNRASGNGNPGSHYSASGNGRPDPERIALLEGQVPHLATRAELEKMSKELTEAIRLSGDKQSAKLSELRDRVDNLLAELRKEIKDSNDRTYNLLAEQIKELRDRTDKLLAEQNKEIKESHAEQSKQIQESRDRTDKLLAEQSKQIQESRDRTDSLFAGQSLQIKELGQQIAKQSEEIARMSGQFGFIRLVCTGVLITVLTAVVVAASNSLFSAAASNENITVEQAQALVSANRINTYESDDAADAIPTLTDYAAIGVTDVTAAILDALNEKVAALNPAAREATDIQPLVQPLTAEIGALATINNHDGTDGDNNVTPDASAPPN